MELLIDKGFASIAETVKTAHRYLTIVTPQLMLGTDRAVIASHRIVSMS
jgi:hypothetical protein